MTGTHEAKADKEMSLTDTVPYHNLKVGKEYTMKGTLMDKATGEPLLIDGKEVTQEVTFTPEQPDGSVELTFTFDGSALGGKTVVAFESCYRDGKEVAVHHDIDAAAQSVDITNPPAPEQPTAPRPKTGDNTLVIPMLLVLFLSGVGVYMLYEEKKAQKEYQKEEQEEQEEQDGKNEQNE